MHNKLMNFLFFLSQVFIYLFFLLFFVIISRSINTDSVQTKRENTWKPIISLIQKNEVDSMNKSDIWPQWIQMQFFFSLDPVLSVVPSLDVLQLDVMSFYTSKGHSNFQ